MLQCSNKCSMEIDMTTTRKVQDDPAKSATSEIFEGAETFVTVYLNGIERLAEVQKKSIDMIAHQSVDLFSAWKKSVRGLPIPGVFAIDLTTSAFEQAAEAQKEAIDLIVENSRAFSSVVNERGAAASKIVDRATITMKESVERTVAAQKKTLDSAAVQTKVAFDKARQQFTTTDSKTDALIESFQRGVDTVIETQKDLLDIAVSPMHRVH